ncbi:MAG: hypothetical protein WC413_03385 [Candidatus Nanoarchaeia archaeon]
MIKKTKFKKLFTINILFTVFLISISLFIKKQMSSYIQKLTLVSYQIQNIQQSLQENITSNIAAANTQLTDLNSMISNMVYFWYIFIPLSFFIIWCIFQSYNFYTLSKEKNFKKYLLRFSIITIPFYLIIIFILSKLFNQLSEFSLIFSIIYLIILLILPYFLLLSYLNINSIKNILKSAKNWKLILLYFVLILLIISYLTACFFLGIYTLAFLIVPILISFLVLIIIISLIILIEMKFKAILN